jgi:hypothetical protein
MKRTIKIRIAIIATAVIFLAMGYIVEFHGPINWWWFVPYGITIGALICYIGYQFWMKLIESWP